jgi:beta-N-acetylhexosaminidase
MRTRAIFGCAGTALSSAEKDFFVSNKPWGFILFARNLVDRPQTLALTEALRATVADDKAPILVDQEGGRVMRLKPPEWSGRPPAAAFGSLYQVDPGAAREAIYLNARLIALDLSEIGINVDCAPLLDLPMRDADPVIGDRAFGSDPAQVIDLGRAFIDGLGDGGVLAVMKHMPGHGRASSDSHVALPRVSSSSEELSATDFVPFRSLNQCPMAMTAHVIYEAIDPRRPATTSPRLIRDVIRGEIGFDGLLMSDDVSMGALSGPISARTKAVLFAGCDIVLHCNGDMSEMEQVAEETGPLDGYALRRADHALAHLRGAKPFDRCAGESRLTELMGHAP